MSRKSRRPCEFAECGKLVAVRFLNRPSLARHVPRHHPGGMVVVTETDAAAIRAAFERGGEFSAAVELRRLFPGIGDNAEARQCARTIAGWKPLTVPLRPVRVRRRPIKG
jgi:hypothetical protein